jgi:hypothetical protein
MIQQPTLFDDWIVITPTYGRDMTIAERFEAFHKSNPAVYARLRDMALAIRRRGRMRYSINGLFETLRWQHAMQTSDPTSDFKLDNSYRAFYSRLLMQQEPELENFFETREQHYENN